MFNLKIIHSIFFLFIISLFVSGCGLIIPNPDVCVVVDEICNDGVDNDCDDLFDCDDSDCVGDEFCVVDCNQESQFFTTDWSNFKYSDLSNLDTDVSKGNLVLENDVSDMVYAFSPTSFDGVWDMKVYDDKLFMAASTLPNGVDDGEIISYDYGSNTYSWEYDVFEQGVIQMEVYDGKIYIPGLDSLGSWSWGNLYIYDGISWERKETVPKANHILGLEFYDGDLYVTATIYEGNERDYDAIVYKSTDDGDTWTEIKRLESGDVVTGFGRGMYLMGVYQDKLYVQTDLKPPEGEVLLAYDGNTWSQIPIDEVTSYSYGVLEEYKGKFYFFNKITLYVYDGTDWMVYTLPFNGGGAVARGIGFYNSFIYGGGQSGVLYRSAGGASWDLVDSVGISDESIEAIESYYGRLYVGTYLFNDSGNVYVSAAKPSGYLVSETHDFGFPINSGTISWNALIPSEETSIKFQIRTANSHSELESLDFVGPDGSTGTYYEISGQALSSAHFGDSLVQYKVYFETSNSALAPVLQDVTISVSCADSFCVPIDEICDDGVDQDCDGVDEECPVVVTGDSWYVSNVQKGNGDGTSWANARNLRDVTANWQAANLNPGDIVYIDGGVNNLTYTYADNWNQQIAPSTGLAYTTFYLGISGNASEKITITRGVDSGHNGKPIIEGAFGSNIGAMYVNGNYLEISHLVFSNKDDFNNRKGRVCITLYSPNYVDILHNEIKYTYGTAILAGNARNVRVMHNKIYTGVTNDRYTEDAFFFSGNLSRDNEFAYNYVLNENNNNNKPPFNDTNPYGAHSDMFQFPANYQQTGGVTKIHHNFIGNIQDTDGYGKQLGYFNQATGTFEIYNNIFVQYSRDDNFYGTTDISIYDIVANNPTDLVVKVYNNNIISDGRYPGIFDSRGIDSLTYKNNLIYAPNIIPGGSGTVFSLRYDSNKNSIPLDVDYNRYYKTDLTRFANMPEIGTISWDTWKSKYGIDTHSSIGPIELVNVGGINPSDYMLVAGSSGIDAGVDLSYLGIFSDDYTGTLRPQGVAWDVGAFER